MPTPRIALALLASAVLCWAVMGSSQAQGFGRDGNSLPERSVTGQFVVHGSGVVQTGSSLARLATNSNYVLLRPTTLTVSSERIKNVIWRELGISGAWRSKIHIVLYPAFSDRDTVTIVSERFRDGWQYRMEVPDLLERSKLIRALCQVLLLEYANRQAGERSAELPLWLVEGFARELLVASEVEMVLTPPQAAANGIAISSTFHQARRVSSLTAVHEHLRANPPLSFEQLSWPLAEDLEGPAGEHYRHCAHLFVHQLLAMEGGREAFCSMLRELPGHMNWQFSFLRAFAPVFKRPLDVEKWWALQTVHFTGRDLAQTWTGKESRRKLEQILTTEVQVRAATNALPVRTNMPLQAIVRQWDRIRQMEVLPNKVRELEMLILRTSEDTVVLADEYRKVLLDYLDSNNMLGPIPVRGKKPPAEPRRTEETARLLETLDQRRLATPNT